LLSRDELQKLYTAFTPDGMTTVSEENQPLERAIRERRPVEAELLLKGHGLPWEGILVRVKAAAVFDNGGEFIGGVSVFQDITERQRLVRQRDALAGLIAHDLKNHLAAESAVAELLLDEFPDKLPEDVLHLLGELKKSNDHYSNLAQSLLEMFKSQAYEQNALSEDLDIKSLLESSLALNLLLAAQKNVNVVLDVPKAVPHIKGIRSAWRHAFHNLMQNAIEASEQGASVEVNVSEDDTGWVVSVTDHGKGMSESEVNKIFIPIKDKTSKPKSSTSSGFGLYLCRMLVEGQGGSISCSSTENKGTTFTVRLPFEE